MGKPALVMSALISRSFVYHPDQIIESQTGDVLKQRSKTKTKTKIMDKLVVFFRYTANQPVLVSSHFEQHSRINFVIVLTAARIFTL